MIQFTLNDAAYIKLYSLYYMIQFKLNYTFGRLYNLMETVSFNVDCIINVECIT
jgi:hypothetical protein